ncbi:MAG TPA: 3-methyl-2-oxobutanoate hydroxymethyltransferase [candidate division Zixibacteria bacterium]|nr:3-methyl-2-oxobutanoate hydroxymethyltransferase [candidate division Zixibacteria bacterium]
MSSEKIGLAELAAMKREGRPIVMVTAYDTPSARLADEAGVDIVFVGDSAANNVLGYADTTPISMDEMVMLARAARRGTHRAFFMVDLPLGAFQVSDEEAVRNAVRMVKETGAEAVKIEGAGPMVSRARAIVGAGIPVMGHIGLTPQSATALGGHKAQGRTAAKARQLFADALALQAAGCFAIVLEAVPDRIAARITEALRIPTIGIGAGAQCSGQVLVWHDLLGINEGWAPKFVRRFADVAGETRRGLQAFAAAVRDGSFPADEHAYHISDAEYALFEAETAPGVLVADDWL